MKIKSPEELGLLIKSVNKIITNETKEQKGGVLGMLLGILGAGLLVNLLAGKTKITGQGVIRTGKGTIAAGQYFFLQSNLLPYTCFEIQNIIKTNLNLMVFIQRKTS